MRTWTEREAPLVPQASARVVMCRRGAVRAATDDAVVILDPAWASATANPTTRDASTSSRGSTRAASVLDLAAAPHHARALRLGAESAGAWTRDPWRGPAVRNERNGLEGLEVRQVPARGDARRALSLVLDNLVAAVSATWPALEAHLARAAPWWRGAFTRAC